MLKIGILFTTSVAFALLLGEMFLRICGYQGESEWTLRDVVRVDDHILNYRLKPNTTTFTGNVAYKLNSKGFRDLERKYEKKDNVYRILVLGDSVAFGYKVDFGEIFSRELEKSLKVTPRGQEVEVVTLAMPGLNTRQESHLLVCEGAKFNPDLILVAFSINDADVGVSYKASDPTCRIELLEVPVPCSLKNVLKRSALLFFLKNTVETFLWKMDIQDQDDISGSITSDYFSRLYKDEFKWRNHVVEGFKSIASFSQALRIPVVLTIFPVMFDFADYKWEWIHEKVANEGKTHNFYVIDLLEEYKKHPVKDLRLERGDFVHPSSAGHRLTAMVVARVFNASPTLWNKLPDNPRGSFQLPTEEDCPSGDVSQ